MNKDLWWGLYENDRLIAVIKYHNRPLIFDFDVITFSSHYYEVREVEIKPLD